MEINKSKGVIESILFSAGREVKITELMSALEASSEEIITVVECMKEDYKNEERGLQIINVGEAYQLCTKQEYYEYLYSISDKRNKPNLSQAAIETLAIIAYNPKITRAEIEAIRGVNSDGTIYKLLGFGNLNELPDLPRYKLDENQQIVIDDIIEEKEEQGTEELNEAPMPERETSKED